MENKNEKEIQIMNFVLEEQRKRTIERGQINSDQNKPIDYDILQKAELERRKQRHSDEKRRIFSELANNEQLDNIKNKYNLKQMAIYAGVSLVAIAAIVLIKKGIDYNNKPINKVVRELAADSGLYETDNGKKISGNMTEEELLRYKEEHNLTDEELVEALAKFAHQSGYEPDLLLQKIYETNPEVFSEPIDDLESGKSL